MVRVRAQSGHGKGSLESQVSQLSYWIGATILGVREAHCSFEHFLGYGTQCNKDHKYRAVLYGP